MTTEYQIKYHTNNHYDAKVTEALFQFLVAPHNDKTQSVTSLSFSNSLGEEIFQNKNPFGFQSTCLRSSKPFTDFNFTMQATVEKLQPKLINTEPYSIAEENDILNSRQFYIDYHLFLEFTPYTSLPEDIQVVNRPSEQPLYDYLNQLNNFIFNLLQYDPDPTNVHTTAGEVYALGKGVCQDYTHLYLAMARKNGIACRYVSGYLNQGKFLMGSALMHAWVEAYIPGLGWRGFDPTNNLLAGINHIKAAHGVDYSDCSPIKGILKTNGKNHTSYEVKVVESQIASLGQSQVQSQ